MYKNTHNNENDGAMGATVLHEEDFLSNHSSSEILNSNGVASFLLDEEWEVHISTI